MRGVIFHPEHNTAPKSDATGAFIPHARAFAKLHDARVIGFDNRAPMGDRAQEVLDALRNLETEVDFVAFACHGAKTQIQAGFRIDDVPDLAEAIAMVARDGRIHVPLFACDAARDADGKREDDLELGPGGDGGFADALRDELSATLSSVSVMAHVTEGHAFWNPFARTFEGPPAGKGGEWIIKPKSRLWSTWRTRLFASDLRYRFPFMSREEIEAELSR